jgi:methylphosphotriester-DNA--protein-cysteine methyltransferase
MPGAEPVVTQLLAALEADPTRRWSESDVAQMGLKPSTVRRAFKRQLGLTFLDLARQRRLQEGFSTRSDGGRLIDAQLDSGFAARIKIAEGCYTGRHWSWLVCINGSGDGGIGGVS